MNRECSSLSHEADKQSPAALMEHYNAHAEPWDIGDARLWMFTCRRCCSTVCIEEKQS